MFGPKWKRGEWRVAGAGRVERIGCAGLGGAGRRVECCSNQNDTSTTTNASRTRRQAHSSVEIDDVLPFEIRQMPITIYLSLACSISKKMLKALMFPLHVDSISRKLIISIAGADVCFICRWLCSTIWLWIRNTKMRLWRLHECV
jgi:hypothetical protein